MVPLGRFLPRDGVKGLVIGDWLLVIGLVVIGAKGEV